MIAVSRKRGYSADRSVATAVVKLNRSASTTGNRSHVQRGSMPDARRNTSTTTRFTARLNRLVSTTASGMTSRGNCVLRTTDS
jgi:hypothetical protein